MRRFAVLMLIAISIAVSSLPAEAHTGGFDAFVTLTPDAPKPGDTVTVNLELRDAYSVAIPATQAEIAVKTDGKSYSKPVALQGSSPGTFSGQVQLPPGPQVYVLVHASMPEFQWNGQFRIVYAEQFSITQADVPLVLSDNPTPSTPAPSNAAPAEGLQPWIVYVGALLLTGAVAILQFRRR